MKKGDFYFGAALLALCCFMYSETFNFYFPKGQSDNPALWPRILLVILAILAIALMVQALRAKKGKAVSTENAKMTKEPLTWAKVKTFFTQPGEGKVLLAVISVVAFNLLFKNLGFVIAVPLFFIALSCIMETPSNWKDFLIRLAQAIVLTGLVYLIFYRLLRVKLPLGFLPKQWFY